MCRKKVHRKKHTINLQMKVKAVKGLHTRYREMRKSNQHMFPREIHGKIYPLLDFKPIL